MIDNSSFIMGAGVGIFFMALANLITSAYESRKNQGKELPK